MCGRYRRRSDKQRIAEAFDVGMGLDELYLDPQDDIAPGSVQPVVESSFHETSGIYCSADVITSVLLFAVQYALPEVE